MFKQKNRFNLVGEFFKKNEGMEYLNWIGPGVDTNTYSARICSRGGFELTGQMRLSNCQKMDCVKWDCQSVKWILTNSTLASTSFLVMPDFSKNLLKLSGHFRLCIRSYIASGWEGGGMWFRGHNGAEKILTHNRPRLPSCHAQSVKMLLGRFNLQSVNRPQSIMLSSNTTVVVRQKARWSEFLQQFEFRMGVQTRKKGQSCWRSGRLCVIFGYTLYSKSKHYVRFHPQLIKV
jgi:hypothetical protein